MKREEGFYWVRRHGYWSIARWKEAFWYFTGDDCPRFEDDPDDCIQEVNENRIIRGT